MAFIELPAAQDVDFYDAGTEPDAAYRAELEPELHQALAIGRLIAPAPA